MTRKTPDLAPPSPNFRTTPAADVWPLRMIFNRQQAPYTVDLRPNQVSNLEPYSRDFITRPPLPCHRIQECMKRERRDRRNQWRIQRCY
ncbi:hypothetical protein AVEN_72617-1 [Araneus ventricosus]|uniref:Uncharacterized protein n=1 Tax=Araneus ventricosus TaxID=182803 RepID=A0A4Y2C3I0_ARAVE|nr:hypothetical protein AVEN_72617-1 [Araneus ventricosus]